MDDGSGCAAVGVVLAAGMGTRVGAGGNKAYLPLGGRSMVSWAVNAMLRAPAIARAVLVFRSGERDLAERTLRSDVPGAAVELVEGGDSRHGSEFNVLRHLAADIDSGVLDVVVIHDGARPVASPDMVATAISVAREFGGAVPALTVPDVVTVGAGGSIESVRGALARVQTPQAFRARPLLRAYRAAERDGYDGTDTSSCVQRYTDVDVRTFRGDERNLKVTYARDIALAERLLSGRPAGMQ